MARFFPRYSIDELPDLRSVFRGDTSLVGPRPFPAGRLDALAPHGRRLRDAVRTDRVNRRVHDVVLGPRIRVALWTLIGLVAAARLIAVFNQNVTRDEFFLLHRTIASLREGSVMGGGRPGLGTVVMMPFAAGCTNAVETLVHARLLWTVFVAASVIAFWVLLRRALSSSAHARIGATTGTLLWALAPPFLHASTQVRTDQPAILFGLLGGIAVLLSVRTLGWAVAAGFAFATGFLFSQKVLYVGGLVAVLAVGQFVQQEQRKLVWLTVRSGITIAAFLAVVVGYRLVMDRLGDAPHMLPVGGQLAFFEYYRSAIGWRLYRAMTPFLVPQAVAAAGLVPLAILCIRRREAACISFGIALGVAAMGAAALLFHAGRLPYFWMVMGLFPATIGALVTASILDRDPSRKSRNWLVVLLWVPALILGVGQAVTMTIPDQQHQRASLEFVERSFPPDATGFEGHTAFSCRQDADPMPVMFPWDIDRMFGGEIGNDAAAEFIDEFRRRPVHFIVPSPGQRYPPQVWEFWHTRYVHYFSTVHVPGRTIAGEAGWHGSIEIIVRGAYVWLPVEGSATPVHVGDHKLRPGETIDLNPGYHDLLLPEGGDGMLVLSLPDPPDPDHTRFYTGW